MLGSKYSLDSFRGIDQLSFLRFGQTPSAAKISRNILPIRYGFMSESMLTQIAWYPVTKQCRLTVLIHLHLHVRKSSLLVIKLCKITRASMSLVVLSDCISFLKIEKHLFHLVSAQAIERLSFKINKSDLIVSNHRVGVRWPRWCECVYCFVFLRTHRRIIIVYACASREEHKRLLLKIKFACSPVILGFLAHAIKMKHECSRHLKSINLRERKKERKTDRWFKVFWNSSAHMNYCKR
jgi:hypothetical protein